MDSQANFQMQIINLNINNLIKAILMTDLKTNITITRQVLLVSIEALIEIINRTPIRLKRQKLEEDQKV